MNITELAQMLSDEIDTSGKTRWSGKDVKEFFLSKGIDIPLHTIIDVWAACPNPVCACALLGCEGAIFANEDIGPMTYDEYFDLIIDALHYLLADTENDYGRREWCYMDPDPSGAPIYDYVPVETMSEVQIAELKARTIDYLYFMGDLQDYPAPDDEEFDSAYICALGAYMDDNELH